MPSALTDARKTLALAAKIARRRVRGKPTHPSWSFMHELLVTRLRKIFRSTKLDIAEYRRALDTASWAAFGSGAFAVNDITLGGVHVRKLASTTSSRDIVLYLHGGGYVAGSPTSHLPLFTHILRHTPVQIWAVAYRLAPEHPCPAAISDVLTVWRTMLQEQGVSPDQVVIAGDSAGGGLVLTSLLAMRDANLPLPRASLLLSPWTDLTVSGDIPLEQFETDYLGSREGLRNIALQYAGKLDLADPRVSPLYAPDLRGLPPTLFLVGGLEVLRDDSVRMIEKLRRAGVEAYIHIEPDGVHVYPIFASVSKSSRRGILAIKNFIQDTRQ